MTLRQLETIYAIMRAGSITAAAGSLHVTQPAVSAVLKHTEQQLKMKLFERMGGRLVLATSPTLVNAFLPQAIAAQGDAAAERHRAFPADPDGDRARVAARSSTQPVNARGRRRCASVSRQARRSPPA